jgi:hypothetical protein
VISGGIVGVLWLAGNLVIGQADENSTAVETPTAGAHFDVVLVQQGLDRRHITWCQAGKCQALTPPASTGTDAVTNGTWWYRYQDKALRRTNIQSGESQLLFEETELVKPRDLFISPDNTKVAFWLDNIDRPEEQLTELWAFDDVAGGTRLLAEKVSQAGVLTPPRWNRASTHLWFLGEAGSDAAQEIELLLVSLNPPRIRAAFTQLDWDKLRSLALRGPMDVSADGATLVYAAPKTRRTSTLRIVREEGSTTATTVRGTVPYVQWLGNGDILYATQQDRTVTFWRIADGRHRRLAEGRGQLQSVRADPAGAYLAFAAEQERLRVGIFTLDLMNGALTEQVSLPSFGSATHVVHAQPAAAGSNAGAGVSAELDDGQLAKFIEEHFADITRAASPQPRRLVITDRPNTVFLDYTAGASSLQRVLVTVRDAVHDEWSVSARFAERGGDWAIVEGGGANSPNAKRLYEWETSLKQWVLKEEY